MTPIHTDQEKNEIVITRDVHVSAPLVAPVVLALPEPRVMIRIRVATLDDIPFMDALQKKHSKQLGFFPRQQMEGYVTAGNVLVAEEVNGETLGYVAYRDRYLKRDELGVIYQLCVAEAGRRKLVAASLLKAVFERSPRGCKLYCCWCAQDLAANKFWEAMGFVPIAFRTGSRTRGAKGKPRVHIYWQKRIRDEVTPWWYPSETGGGAMMENRLVLPVPMGMRWDEAMPVMLPGAHQAEIGDAGATSRGTPRLVSAERSSVSHRSRSTATCGTQSEAKPATVKALSRPGFGAVNVAAVVAPAVVPAVKAPLAAKAKREKRKALPNDPALVKKARDLRDRWFEHVNDASIGLESNAKYAIESEMCKTPPLLQAA